MGAVSRFPNLFQAVVLLALATLGTFSIATSLAVPLTLTSPALAQRILQHPATLASVNLLILGTAIWCGFILTKQPARRVFPLRWVRLPILLVTVPVVIGMQTLLSEIDNLTRLVLPPPAFLDALFGALISGHTSLWGSILALVIVAPLTEEFLFRGLVLQAFLQQYRPARAIVLTAVLFALFHINPWQMPCAFAVGLLLGWITAATGSLIPGLLGHAIANGFPIIIASTSLATRIPGFANQSGEKIVFQPLWMDITAALVVGIGLLLLHILLRRTPPAAAGEDEMAVSAPQADGMPHEQHEAKYA